MSFTEASLENIIIDKIKDIGYKYVEGSKINRATLEDVLIEEDLRLFANLKTNPEFYKIFTGDKDDAVGPGSYELLFPEDWKKTGTSW